MSDDPANPPPGASVTTELSAVDVERLDAWIAGQPEPRPTRAQAVRRVLAQALETAATTARPAIPDEAAVPELPKRAAGPYDGSPM